MKPDTIAEAAQSIADTFDAEQLREWLLLPEREAQRDAHFGLGAWIRNRWIYGDRTGIALAYQRFSLFGNPDEVSGLIAHDVWRHLNGLPAISRPEQAFFRSSETLTWD